MIHKESWYREAKDDLDARLKKIEDEHKKAKEKSSKMVKRLRNMQRELQYLADEMER